MSETLTPWFKWPATPVREGAYLYRGAGWSESMLVWNGQCFGYWQGDNWVQMADDESDQWRGLASDPKAK